MSESRLPTASSFDRSWRTALLAVVVVTLSRLGILWRSILILEDHIEWTRGLLPLHLERGLLMPFFKYQYDPYAGGGMIMGLLAYPFFQILGPTAFAMKMGSLILTVLMFLFLFLLMRRCFDNAGAVLLAVIFLFPPASFLIRSLTSLGLHMEVGTLMAAGLLAFMAAQVPRNSRMDRVLGRRGWLALFGLISGFGVYFSYDYLILLAVTGVFFVVSTRSFADLAVETLLMAVCFLVGFFPWFVFHETYTLSAFIAQLPHTPKTQHPDQASFNNLALFFETVTVRFAAMFQSHDLIVGWGIRVPGKVLDLSIFTTVIGCYGYVLVNARKAIQDVGARLVLIRRGDFVWTREHRMLPVLVYIPLHLVIWAMYPRPFAEPYPPLRYLFAIYPFLFLVTAIGLGELWQKGKKKIAAVGLVLFLLGGMGGNMAHIRVGEPGQTLSRPGYSHLFAFELLVNQYRFHGVDYDYNYLTQCAQAMFPGPGEPVYTGIIAGIAYMNGVEIPGHIEALKGEGPDAYAAFVGGLAASVKLVERPDPLRVKQMADLVGFESQPAFQRGLWLGELLKEYSEDVEKNAAPIPSAPPM